MTLTFRLGSQGEDESQQVYTKLTEPDKEQEISEKSEVVGEG